MQKQILAAFAAVAFSSFAADPAPRTGDLAVAGFENQSAGAAASSTTGWEDPDGGSAVAAYAEGEAPSGIDFPRPFADAGDNYLSVDSGDSEVKLSVAGNTAKTYIDTLVQFPATEEEPDVDSIADAKILFWLKSDGTLCAKGGYLKRPNYVYEKTMTPTTYELGKVCEKGKWYRLTVTYYPTIGNEQAEKDGEYFPGFTVKVDGEPVATATAVGDYLEPTLHEEGYEYTDDAEWALVSSGQFIPSMETRTDSGAVTQVAFSGTGAVDDLVVTEIDPDLVVTDMTPYGFPFTETAGQNGSPENPYEIPNVAALKALQKAVAAGVGNAYSYVQTANIDMASAGQFSGIGTYAVNPDGGVAFTGVYDGRGFKISNITMTARNYGGVFNQVNGGTIKNLTVENVNAPAGASGEYGYAIVGHAARGATLEGLVAAGSFGTESRPGTHNMAGIVIRALGGASGETTTISGCTNNAAIYGSYTKLAGICAITQAQTKDLPAPLTAGKVAFVDCANNGDLYLSRNATDVTGFAGIVAYTADDTVLEGCSNTGSINNVGNGANTDCNGQLVGQAFSYTLSDNGGNSASAGGKMVGKYTTNGTITGFTYATVASGVATTVAGAPVAGGEYLLERNAAPVLALAENESVSFDAAFGYTLDEDGISAAEGLSIARTQSGTVATFTATAASAEPFPEDDAEFTAALTDEDAGFGIDPDDEDGFAVTFVAPYAGTYTLQCKESLSEDDDWTDVAGSATAAAAGDSVKLVGDADQDAMFFRVNISR